MSKTREAIVVFSLGQITTFLLKNDQYFYGFIQITVHFTLLVEVLKEQTASSKTGTVEGHDFIAT